MNAIIAATTATLNNAQDTRVTTYSWADIMDRADKEQKEQEAEKPKINLAPTYPWAIPAPSTPKEVLKEATMEIVTVTVHRTKPANSDSTDHSVSSKPKGTKMSLREYYEECAKKEEELKVTEQKVAEQKATETPKKRRNKKKNKKNTGWEEVKKDTTQWAQISFPQKWSKGLFKTTDTPKDKKVNTTLILKNLPYDGTTDRDLKRFFGKVCGPIKFVKILRSDDGKCKGVAFIRFENKKGSDWGLTLNGFWYENRRVYVEYAEDRR